MLKLTITIPSLKYALLLFIETVRFLEKSKSPRTSSRVQRFQAESQNPLNPVKG